MSFLGVIPRAATALFESLTGTSSHTKSMSASGIRAPNRYSREANLQAHSGKEKNWQLKATYVEVR